MNPSRLDRQLRIAGWDQKALDRACIGVVGDNDRLASLFVLSASALGINRLVVIAPTLNPVLTGIATKINPLFNLTHFEGFYAHPALARLFDRCNAIVDLSHYGLASKLLIGKAFEDRVPVVRGFCYEQGDVQGFRVFTYLKGREWRELEQIVCPWNLPSEHFDDGVLDTIVAGMTLEEVKNLLMQRTVSDALITYERTKTGAGNPPGRALIVGAGALGTFVGLGLAFSGLRGCTIMDPDVVEPTNLNRQVLFYDALGRSKAETLSERLNTLFGMRSSPCVAYFQADTDLSPYDVVLDCVDNFEARIVLSESCKAQSKPLISGGTSAEAGQVVGYSPARGGPTPAELLGLYEIVGSRTVNIPVRDRASCSYQPDPSVVMTNQVTAGLMVDACRRLGADHEVESLFYDSTRSARLQGSG